MTKQKPHKPRPRLADGSTSDNRMEAATIRALDPWIRLERQAQGLIDILDQVTAPGVVRNELPDDDSLVIAIKDATPPRRE